MNLKFNFAKNYFFQSFGVLFLIVVSICFANGQSKDIKNPTPLNSNEISGVIDKNTRDNTYYYYSFWANPGEVEVTVTTELSPNFDTSGFTGIIFSLSDSNLDEIANKTVGTFPPAKSATNSVKVQIKERKKFTLGIKIQGGIVFDGVGTFKMQIKGADIASIKETKKSTESLGSTYLSALSSPTITFPSDGFIVCSLKNQSGSLSLSLNLIKGISIYNYPKNETLISELTYGTLTLPSSGKFGISLKTEIGYFIYDLGQISKCEILGK